MRALIYDIEIIKAIPSKNGERITGIEYCEGWKDHANMGISVIGAMTWPEGRAHVWLADNFADAEFVLTQADLRVGFNSIPFDNSVLRANDINLDDADCYDILRELWAAHGLGSEFAPGTHTGFSLDATARKNLGAHKTGDGAMAPVDWQQGRRGKVIDYCLNDAYLTWKLFDRIMTDGELLSPVGLDKAFGVKSDLIVQMRDPRG